MKPRLASELRESAGSNWARFDVCSHEDALLRGQIESKRINEKGQGTYYQKA